MSRETLVAEMIEFKALYPTLTIDQVLKVFEIESNFNLINAIEKARIFLV